MNRHPRPQGGPSGRRTNGGATSRGNVQPRPGGIQPNPNDHRMGCVALPAMAASVATARMYIRHLMEKWNRMAVVDEAELVVSEIVTNAIKAATLLHPKASYPELYDKLEVVRLTVWLLRDEVLIEVWDRSDKKPKRQEVSLDEEGGRGLFLVESVCTAWGTRPEPSGGKVVWARIAA